MENTGSAEDSDGQELAKQAVRNTRALLSDFEESDVEVQHGAIKHAIEELEIARSELPKF